MVYRILLGVAITFIIAGIVLAVISVIVFFKKNMAEVYDFLLGRNFSEKFNKSSTKNKTPQNITSRNKEMHNKKEYNAPVQMKNAPIRQPANYAKRMDQINTENTQKNAKSFNSGNTTVLGKNQGSTTVLNDKKKDFVVTKDLTYTYTNESI